MTQYTKRKWALPEVHRYGTFQDATKQLPDCLKTFGTSDGFTFGQDQIGLECAAS